MSLSRRDEMHGRGVFGWYRLKYCFRTLIHRSHISAWSFRQALVCVVTLGSLSDFALRQSFQL
jgi:hypothetical protein